ncbi:MAG TPA: energy transducer TonB [Longimicrobium sp.]|nr:energy transducer TonB [Longimicrobium sp.]
MSGDAAVCPHCGFPRPAGPAAPPANAGTGGTPAGWWIFGGLAVIALVVGLLGWGVYRVLQRVNPPGAQDRWAEAGVDFVDTARARMATQPDFTGTGEGSGAADSSGVPGEDEEGPELLNREEVAQVMGELYPPLMRAAGVQGEVTLRMRVERDGTVDPASIQVLSTSHESFSDAAIRVARQFRFLPARYRGEAVPAWVSLPIQFELAL